MTNIDTDPVDLPELVPISARLPDLLAHVADIHPSMLDLGCGDRAGAIRLIQAGAGSGPGMSKLAPFA